MTNPATQQIYGLTAAGAHALAADDAIQARLDRCALDDIAHVLSEPGSSAEMLAAIAGLVRGSRRTVRTDRTV